jgi:hypothetical protein
MDLRYELMKVVLPSGTYKLDLVLHVSQIFVFVSKVGLTVALYHNSELN